MDSCFGFALVGLACARWLRERPPAAVRRLARAGEQGRGRGGGRGGAAGAARAAGPAAPQGVDAVGLLGACADCRRRVHAGGRILDARDVVFEGDGVGPAAAPRRACASSRRLCEGRYRGYVFALVAGASSVRSSTTARRSSTARLPRRRPPPRQRRLLGRPRARPRRARRRVGQDSPAARSRLVALSRPPRWRGGGVGAERQALADHQLSGARKSTIAAVGVHDAAAVDAADGALLARLRQGGRGGPLRPHHRRRLDLGAHVEKSFPSILRGEGAVAG